MEGQGIHGDHGSQRLPSQRSRHHLSGQLMQDRLRQSVSPTLRSDQ